MKIKQYFLSFLLCYYTLHIFSFVLSFAFEPVVRLIGEFIFNIDYAFDKNGYGSGDNTYSYLETFMMFCTSVVLAFPIAYFIHKKELEKGTKHYFLVLLRVYLAFFMLVYGISKILPMQFPPMSLHQLSESYGESSPMRLAWTFMQYSPYYTAFTGFAEVLGGLLLLNRRTTTLGAVILTGVIANVVMMNFSYDIPVKIFSVHMLMACLIILSADIKRVIRFFILNKEVEPKVFYPLSQNTEKLKKISTITTSLKVVFIAGISILFGFQYFEMAEYDNKISALYGIYDVVPSKQNMSAYKTFIFDKYDMASIRTSDDKKVSYSYTVDTKTKTVSLKSFEKKNLKEEKFTYTETKEGLQLQTSNAVQIHLKKKSEKDLLLVSRGFNWINESPFNR